MKKLIIATFALVSLTANATLSNTCKQDLDEVIAIKILVQKDIESGKMTSGKGSNLLSMFENTADTTALMCAGLKKLELERSLAGKLGLISQERANQIAEKTYQEALEYYLNSSNK